MNCTSAAAACIVMLTTLGQLPLPALIAVYVPCAMLVAAGLWLVIYRSDGSSQERAVRRLEGNSGGIGSTQTGSGEPAISGESVGAFTKLQRFRARLSPATRIVLGWCLLLVGYHLAAYASPTGWFGLMIPMDKWYILAVGIGLALTGTMLADKLERHHRLDAAPSNQRADAP